ncbi:MAG: 23S rRNA (uracil(1939)-C(5))-methyltransferase RlmD [bacterium]|nr:23S rRNA (uracil(1939)-C(5))-methyltransferase RlmD [bacterium]
MPALVKPITVKEKVNLKIENLIFGGEALARYQGFTIFLPYGCPGDEVEAEVTEVKKDYARAKITKIITPSPDRINPPCPYFYCLEEQVEDKLFCGGCDWQHIKYETQLQLKTAMVKDALKYIARFKEPNVLDIIPAEASFNYRNKMQLKVGLKEKEEGKKKITCGFYAKNTHHIIDIEKCQIQTEVANEILALARQLLGEYELPGYDEETHRGLVRHIIVRAGVNTDQYMLIFVTKEKDFPNKAEIAAKIMERFPQVLSVIQNINKAKTNVILGEDTLIIAGKLKIQEKVKNLFFDISPVSFFQTNTRQAERLYDTVLTFAGLSGQELVLDVYCGAGAIALYLAPQAQKVIGIESGQSAVKDAMFNADWNKIENVEFRLGEADLVLSRLYKQQVKPDVIVVDPPRKGLTQKVIDAIINLAPKRIIYVSCEPSTMARDLQILHKKHYKLEVVQPVDMFPQTAHIECVAKIVKVNKAEITKSTEQIPKEVEIA